jgi:ribosome-binding factor A
MPTYRRRRIDELLRETIGELLTREVVDPRIGFATVTEVETTPDLGHARVWVSVIGETAERAATIAALERAMVFVRRELGHRLHLRRIPELQVRLDESADRGTRVLRLLADIEAGREPTPLPEGESLPQPVPRRAEPVDATAAPGSDEAEPAVAGRRGRRPSRSGSGTDRRSGPVHGGRPTPGRGVRRQHER